MGLATASYALPAGQPGGVYTITAVYNPGADFTGSTNTGTLTIGAGTVAVGPATLPNGTVGTAYSQTITATGGSGTGYTFAVTAGALPTGLALNGGTGAITGTPTAAGTACSRYGDGQRRECGQPAVHGDDRGGDGDADGAGGRYPGQRREPATLKAGQQAQLTATATLSDGTTPDVTNQATWSSSNRRWRAWMPTGR